MNRVLRPVALSRLALSNPAAAAALRLASARNVSILLNKRSKSQTSESSANESKGVEGNSRIDVVSRGLTNIFQGKTAPAPVDPRFEVIDSGYGSLVLAKMPPYSQFYTQVGQTLGQSPHAKSRATTNGALAVAALRPLLGRKAFVQEISTDDLAAEILISPKKPGDVSVVAMDGSADYYVRRSSLLALTRFLKVSTWSGLGAGFNALAFDKVSGQGTAVINTFGGLHRLVLSEGEEYLVDPRYVVAWTSTLDIAPQSGKPRPLAATSSAQAPDSSADTSAKHPQTDTSATETRTTETRTTPLVSSSPAVDNKVSAPSRSPAAPIQAASVTTEKGSQDKKTSALSSLATKIARVGFLPAWRAIKSGVRGAAYASANAIRVSGWAAAKTTRTLAGVPDLYRVTGPGYIYVSTRLTPKPWTRITNAIAAKSSAH
ncbi:hypothetical protein GGI12_000085 [Dipsacomyces acuminosporus]|nr:hypothetical protein GGI12_000085 [Dipsacomyces acuminosporus]